MVRYFISAHGRMASGMKASLDILLGSSRQVTVFDAYVDETNVDAEIKRQIEAVDSYDYLVMMSDLTGGSVNQIMMKYMERERTFLVTGINLAAVVGLVAGYPEQISAEDIEAVLEQSRTMMFLVKKDDAEIKEDEFF